MKQNKLILTAAALAILGGAASAQEFDDFGNFDDTSFSADSSSGSALEVSGTLSTDVRAYVDLSEQSDASASDVELEATPSGTLNLNYSGNKSDFYYVRAGVHAHSFSYQASANTITATCTGFFDCPDGYAANPITITVNKTENLTYDATAKTADISGYPETEIEGLDAEPSVAYFKSTGEGSTTVSGNALAGAPANAGDYVAQITWGGQTAAVAFRIERAELIVTAKDMTLVYNGEIQGPGDEVFEDPAEIAKMVTVSGLQGSDALSSVIVDGQGKDVGSYELMPSGAAVGDATDNYDITYVNGTLKITDKPAIDKKQAKISLDEGLMGTSSKGKVTARWGRVKDADFYEIFATYCGEDTSAYRKIKTVNGKISKLDIKKLAGKKLNPKRSVKYYVVAYKTVDGKKVKLARSLTVHVVGSGNTGKSNIKSIQVTKKNYTLKKGKTAKIKAKLVLYQKGKKTLDHERKFRYATSNDKVATVSKNGKIKVVGKGKCDIYVYAQNGCAKKIKVTVN